MKLNAADKLEEMCNEVVREMGGTPEVDFIQEYGTHLQKAVNDKWLEWVKTNADRIDVVELAKTLSGFWFGQEF